MTEWLHQQYFLPHDILEKVVFKPIEPYLMIPFYKFSVRVASTYLADVPDPEADDSKRASHVEAAAENENVSKMKKLRRREGAWISVDGGPLSHYYPELIEPACVSLNLTLIGQLLNSTLLHYRTHMLVTPSAFDYGRGDGVFPEGETYQDTEDYPMLGQ